MMMFDLPHHDTLYQALIQRDARYDGRVFVCVTTTGIFCRLTCAARKPNSVNCIFQPTIAACMAGGYRACKRCHPLQAQALGDQTVIKLLAALDAQPALRWSEDDVAAMGLDPSTVRRSFKRHFGMTFLDMARQRRIRDGFDTLSSGGKVIEAQMDAGFGSASAFRAGFSKLLGVAPGSLGTTGLLLANWINTPLGDMIAVSSASHLHLLEFVGRKALPAELTKLRADAKGSLGIGSYGPSEQIESELAAYFAGTSAQFTTPLATLASPFTQSVWSALRQIPVGTTCTYLDLARQIGRPDAVRAVARANGANQIALVIPCHRVLGVDGALTGYGGGLWRKQRLIEIERQYCPPTKTG